MLGGIKGTHQQYFQRSLFKILYFFNTLPSLVPFTHNTCPHRKHKTTSLSAAKARCILSSAHLPALARNTDLAFFSVASYLITSLMLTVSISQVCVIKFTQQVLEIKTHLKGQGRKERWEIGRALPIFLQGFGGRKGKCAQPTVVISSVNKIPVV